MAEIAHLPARGIKNFFKKDRASCSQTKYPLCAVSRFVVSREEWRALRDDLRTLAMSQVVANIPQFDYGIQI